MTLHRSILLFPDLTNAPQIARYRDRFDPLAAKISPHVTLVFPFELVDLKIDALTLHVAERIRTIRSFTLEAAIPAIIEDGCVSLRVTFGANQVRRLHDSLYAGLLRPLLRTDLEYVPHMTIGRFTDEKTVPDARRSLKELSGPFTAPIREVVIESFEVDGR